MNPLDDIMVGIPMGEVGYQKFWQHLCEIPDFGYLISKKRVRPLISAYVHGSHNQMVKEALESDISWKRFVMIEHDHGFPLDVFQRHAQYQEPIVCATYVLRDPNSPLPVFYNWDAPRANALHPKADLVKHMLENPGLHEADVVPMGCTSIKREVFETWPKDQPMYNSSVNPRGACMSDDVWFCRIAQDNGWQPYVDTNFRIDHYCLFPLNIATFVRWYNTVWVPQAEKDAA